ncbi:MAG: MFS transporter, partial [Clostridia bacterium]|nr:MFS transporter [Clostridia bacterium]
MKAKNKYYLTVRICRMTYLVQGILNNFLPLLFLHFIGEFGFSFNRISFLIVINFGIQMVVDYLSAKWVDYFGYRKCIILSQLLSFAGLVGLAFLPGLVSGPYIG